MRLFSPWGESWTGANLNNCNTHQTFAQLYDYDPEIDMYNTPHRHYSPSGRWPTPDPGGMSVIHPDAPQTWNRYAYVANNPTTLADPSGLDPPPPPGSSANMDSTIDPDCMLKDAERILATLNANGSEEAAEVAQWAAEHGETFQMAALEVDGLAGGMNYYSRLSRTVQAYLDKYYAPVSALAEQYKVDPVLVLAVGMESAFASKGAYLHTGDAFGMTGGDGKPLTFKSPQENVAKFFALYGEQIRGTGSNDSAFVNALQGENAKGERVKGWKAYNRAYDAEFREEIANGITEMRRDVPIYLSAP